MKLLKSVLFLLLAAFVLKGEVWTDCSEAFESSFAVSETAAEAMDSPGATPEERQKIAQKARLLGDTVAFLAGRDVASADKTGSNAVENNFLSEDLIQIDGQRAIIKAVFSEEEAKPYLEMLDNAEKRTLEGIKDPIVNTIAVSAVGMGVPLVARAAATIGTIATVQHFGSIAVDSGTQGLVQEAKDHSIMTTLAMAPFVPVPKVLNVVKNTTKTEQATQAVQQEFKFVQKLQPAKNVETVVQTTQPAVESSIANAINKAPYDARAMESLLQKNNPGATVTSSTLPPASGPNVRVAGNALEKEIKLPSGSTKTISAPFDNRGLPMFDKYAVVETRISGDLSSMSGDAHMRMATRQLREDIKAGRVDKNLFTKGQLEDIQKGEKTIEGFIWHHDGSVKGRMQLVPEEIHEAVRHQGGNTMWRGGKK